MRDDYFKRMRWARIFISGPTNPLKNKYRVFCHICKKNLSMYSKGPREIERHFKTERHLRRDERWRYEYLRTVDPVTGEDIHQVRGRDTKVLTKFELAKELPHFIDTELVELGERRPFYHEFIGEHPTSTLVEESRAATQLAVLGSFVGSCGNIQLLQRLWGHIGSYSQQQESFQNFTWDSDSLAVSTFFMSRNVIIYQDIFSHIASMLPVQFVPDPTYLFVFQAMFHHYFVSGLAEIGERITSELQYAIEFEDRGLSRFMFARFWKGDTLCKVLICRSGVLVRGLNGELGSLARLMSAISTQADIVSCSGVPLDFVKILDKFEFQNRGMQFPFKFGRVPLRELMHKESFSVFGRIDFFSVLQALVVSLGGCTKETWALNSTHLMKVRNLHFGVCYCSAFQAFYRNCFLGSTVMPIGRQDSPEFMP